MAEVNSMPNQEDYAKWLGSSVYSILDPETIQLLRDEDMEDLIPALSHLNRMTTQTKDEIAMDNLDLEYIFMRKKAIENEADYEEKRGSLLETLLFFARHIPTDTLDGFKAKLQAYQVKIIRTQLEEVQKKKGR